MTDERWVRIRDLVERALDLEQVDRRAFLDEACAGDEDLRRQVEALLEVDAPEEFLEPPDLRGKEVERGFVLGDFRILRELGRGGMGVVYLARQDSLDRDVALKVFHESVATTEREIERFHREARAVARLSHPGIVRVIAEGREERAHWFAMEYVPGHDLAREIELQRGRTPADDEPLLPSRDGEGYHAAVAGLVADVADALHHAHGKGLVHRDVKPQNILLQPNGRPLLVDFGIVHDEHLGALTVTGELTGTPYYMSPEQARAASSKVDHRTDVYSLGAVLYELLTGKRAHDGPTQADVLLHIREVVPPGVRSLAPTVPVDLATICEQAMRPEVEKRYADAHAFEEDLRRFLAHEPILARPRSVGEKALAWGKKHRLALTAVALLAGGLWVGSSYARSGVRAATMARVQLEVVDDVGEPVVARVGRREVDPSTGLVGELEWLGRGDEFDEFFEAGIHRFVLQAGDRLAVLTRYLEVGDVLRERVRMVPPDLEGMVLVPAGEVTLEAGPPTITELHGRPVSVPTLHVDRTEVSNADWLDFANRTGAPVPSYFEALEADQWSKPVAGISWADARAYAEFHGKRLPSFWEWSLAARGPEARRFPWGNDLPDRGNASRPVEDRLLASSYLRYTVAIDSMPESATPGGLLHMLGNVAEWTESPGTITRPPRRGHDRVVAGGDWSVLRFQDAPEGPDGLWFAFGYEATELVSSYTVGFRCVRDVYP